MPKLPGFVLLILIGLSQALMASDEWKLTDPQVFDLRIPKTLFVGKLKGAPHIKKCHTQGLAVTDSQILISCCLYDTKDRKSRAYQNEAYLLSTDLNPILTPQTAQKPKWKLFKITGQAPLAENERISRSVLKRKSTFDHASDRFPMGHPSGITPDRKTGNVWIALSVYGPHSYSRIRQYNLESGSFVKQSFDIPDHLGALVYLKNHWLVGLTWGSDEFLVLNTLTGEWKKYPNNLPEKIDYQECEAFGDETFICAGNLIDREWRIKRRIGRIDFIRMTGNDIHDVRFERTGQIENLGIREFIQKSGLEAIEKNMNDYGSYRSPLTLTNEGMSLSPDGKFIYLLPEDIPGGKMIRYRLEEHFSD